MPNKGLKSHPLARMLARMLGRKLWVASGYSPMSALLSLALSVNVHKI
ncbi:hypothetical protein SAMN05216562_2539 [Microbulbifer marinus]|uniref:Uncharacterized protein n=1 Tax=Microbulbifer marinus TaxID=658218 RepID=A0A1H4A4W3_9GAMM|nr:hypothetical protein SAMN05216562_2539 [Microbulbifer marinus]